MGWYAIAEAIRSGRGPYGTVREALRGESDPARSLAVAVDEVLRDRNLDRAGRARLAYWRRKANR